MGFFEVCTIIPFRNNNVIILASLFVYEEYLQNLSSTAAFTRRDKCI